MGKPTRRPTTDHSDPGGDIGPLRDTLNANPDAKERYEELLAYIRAHRRAEQIERCRPESEFPELDVTVPDSWDSIQLAPLYDVHLGHERHDHQMFLRHLRWIRETPNVLTWNGGDLIENASKHSVGAGWSQQMMRPNSQLLAGIRTLAPIAHKMLFQLPGNHEDRTDEAGFSVASWASVMLEVPYFSDYAFIAIKWRGNRFRLLAHHGSGAAATAGGRTMAARKDIAWAKPFDLFWTGHLHNSTVDVLYQTDADQQSGRIHERNGFVIISPSYLKYFGTYAAKKRYPPGTRGLAVVTLRPDGRMDTMLHANGKRL